MDANFALSASKMQARICDLANRRRRSGGHNPWVDYRKWLEKEFERTGKPKAGLARVWGRTEGSVSRALAGTRQLKADEFEKARAYFATTNEISTPVSENGPAEEEKEAEVHEVIAHIQDMIDEYGREVVRKAFFRAFRPQTVKRQARP